MLKPVMPGPVVEIRADICARCLTGCDEAKAGLIHHQDAGAACPAGHWGPWISAALPRPQSPPLWLKAKRLRNALGAWWGATRGHGIRRLLGWRAYARRRAICGGCDYFSPKGNAWLGECQAPGCGCTKAKLWLPTARCPHPEGPKWDRETP